MREQEWPSEPGWYGRVEDGEVVEVHCVPIPPEELAERRRRWREFFTTQEILTASGCPPATHLGSTSERRAGGRPPLSERSDGHA